MGFLFLTNFLYQPLLSVAGCFNFSEIKIYNVKLICSKMRKMMAD